MEKINWKVEGMSCTNCALSVNKFLQEQGMQEVKVNFMAGDVSFQIPENSSKDKLIHGIQDLGYKVAGVATTVPAKRKWFKNHLQRFWFCFLFTAPLMLHMVPGLEIHFLMNPSIQLGLTIPVFLVGMDFFGRSALKSLRRGIPNMNVLIALGAVAAFGYSLYGTLIGEPDNYLFYESAATIITLVFLGNWMEDRSVEITQASLKKLATQQQSMANMIAYDDQHQEHVFPVKSESLKVGDLLLIRAGEQVPMDCKILWGEASVNESLLSGESVPLTKKMNDYLIGGSVLESGTIKAYVTAVGEDTVLSGILRLVKDAQAEKPPVQQLADKISAIFVPTVISLSLLSFLINYFFAHQAFSVSLLRSIAILVIACPCAMGLATPAAIAVGLGRAARNGILFRNAKTLELFRNIKQVVFDKTGTLTTGHFTITHAAVTGNISREELQRIAFSLEKYSTHPIALAISREWKTKDEIRWQKIEEIKGLGMQATDKEGNQFLAGSFQIAAKHTIDYSHNVYILRNNELLGWIDVADEIRPEAKEIIGRLHQQGIHTILLSGDKKEKSAQVAAMLGIQEVYAEQNPQQKLETITRLNQSIPTAMVGDGINDAPALAKATVGISLSQSTQLAMQTATVVLMNQGLKNLPMALGLGEHTYQTIKENLFWAFAYNIVAIPIAAMGLLNPTFAALAMGLSDVVLAINSVRLNFKKVN